MEWVDINLTAQGNICEPKNSKIALIDADTIIVGACSTCEYYEELLPRYMYNDEEWDSITSEEGYDPITNMIAYIDIAEAYAHAMNRIEMIMQETGCADFELHFTGGRKSFRYTIVADNYKANRQVEGVRTIYGIWPLKQEFLQKHAGKAFLNEEYEADDAVVTLKKFHPDKYILCAVDKDVLYSLPGRHFNYYSSLKYGIQMKFIEVDEDVALKHHYRQCLTGDAGDNIIGLKGIGPKTADKLLANCTTHQECWNVVVEQYALKGRDELDAITNMRLANMQQLNENMEVVLWKPSL
jgi:DNA polymerase-1